MKIGYMQEWKSWPGFTSYDTTVNSCNGILNVTSTTTDPRIEMYTIGSFDPNLFRYIQMRYRVASGSPGITEIFFCNNLYASANGAQQVQGPALVADGTWHIYELDMWVHANWKTQGNITGWRWDWCTGSGCNIEFDWIRITSKSVGRLQSGDLAISGQFSERKPAVTNGLIAHYPLDGTAAQYVPSKVRYIRDSLNGSTVNGLNHWVELQAIDYDGVNVALNKAVSANGALGVASPRPLSGLVDGDITAANYIDGTVGCTALTVDLGALYNVKTIKVWHYYGDNRMYFSSKTEVSDDGVTWYIVFDSAISGIYAETSVGNTIELSRVYHTKNVTWMSPVGVTTGNGYMIKSAATAAWDAGARSVETISGDGFMQTVVSMISYPRMIGLNNVDADKGLGDLDFALYFSWDGAGANSLQIYEQGSKRGDFGTYAIGDIFRIEVVNNKVYYVQNGSVIYTSPLTPTFPLFVDTTMYSQNGTLCNVKLGTYPSSGVTFLQNSVAVEEVTTNYINNGNFSNGLTSWIASGNATTHTLIDTPYGKGIRVARENGDGGNWPLAYAGGAITYSAGETWTFSFKFRTVRGTGTPFAIGWWISDNGGYRNSLTKVVTDLGNGWKYCTCSYTFVGGPYAYSDSMFMNSQTSYTTVDFAEIQLEKKAFATSFVDGSRSVAGRIDIPFTLLPPYTINLKHKPSKPLAQIVDQPSSPMILQMGTYYTNASLSLWNYIKELNVYIKADGSFGWASTATHHTYTGAEWDSVEHEYAIVAVDYRTFKVYMDGTYLGQQTSTGDVTSITYISMGNAYMPNAAYRSLSIYNRALSDAEIRKLQKGSMSLHDNGDITTDKLTERPCIPSDAFYFPLTATPDSREGAKSSSAANLCYQDGGVFVSNTTINVVSNWDLNTGWSQEYCTNIRWNEIGPPPGVSAPVVGFEDTALEGMNGYWYSYGDYCPQADGTTYTISLYVKVTAPLRIAAFTADNTESAAGGRYSGEWIWVYPEDGWKRCVWAPFTTPTPCISDSLSFQMTTTVSGQRTWLCAPQMEAKSFATPFAAGTRSASDLEFNLYNSIGMDWNGNWSLVYWKMPVGTSAANLTGYSLDSLGANSNPNGGYYWWGKTNTVDTLLGGGGTTMTPGTFTPSDYFNKWHMVSVVRNGGTTTFKLWGIGGQTHTSTYPLGAVGANWFVNQFGYDLKLGGWDENNVCNASFRDLIVAKRALSDAELDSIRNTFLRQCSDGSMQLQGKLIEGVML